MSDSTLAEQDLKAIWHPFTPQKTTPEPLLAVTSAEGAYLHLEGGVKILDAISSWWVNIHGHCHPTIARAIAEQASRLEHVIFAGFTHAPAVNLANALLAQTQKSGAEMAKVFYSDDGSTAVEVALKLAYQYFLNQGITSRKRFIALKGAYHGDTFGSMAVSDPTGFHARFKDLLAPVDFVEPGDVQSLKALVGSVPDQYSAMIIEPMVQGAGGMRFYSAEFLTQCRELCDSAGILLICDEIFTGFFRTGRFFAFEHAPGFRPDLICISKGLTGGFLPLSATLVNQKIHAAFTGSNPQLNFLHGHSYTANPIACAAALASLELLNSPECQAQIARLSEQTQTWIARLSRLPGAHSARSLGTLGAITLNGAPEYGSDRSIQLRREALARGVLLRPLGSVLYVVPPYCVTKFEVDQIYSTLAEIIQLKP